VKEDFDKEGTTSLWQTQKIDGGIQIYALNPKIFRIKL
jgi:hypothetical protein